MTPQNSALIGRLQQNLADIEQVVDRTDALLQKYLTTQDEDYLGTIALNLHGFYTGTERVFEEVARSLDESLPTGSDWHRRLLQQMSADLPEIRPAVIQPATRHLLDDYRAFRHVVRNIYTFDLRGDRIQALAAGLRTCYQELRQDTDQFCAFLRQL